MAAPKGSRPSNAGKGRPKGSPNKMTRALKDIILQALDEAGGAEYLKCQADKNPIAFMALLGKVLPMRIAGDPAEPLRISWIRDGEFGGGEQ
jgi:hypothetical protein